MMRLIFPLLACLVTCFGIITAPAVAHEGRPLYIELEEKEGRVFFLKWRVPSTIERGNLPGIAMPASCEKARGPETAQRTAQNLSRDAGQGLFVCGEFDAPLTLEIYYPQGNPSVSTLVRLTRPSGEVQVVKAGPSDNIIVLPDAENARGVAGEYLILGVEHILTGYDHLLFVACLLMLAGTFRRVLWIITGFTLAHSVTLALAALDLVSVAVPPLEAAIALSIVFVAAELVRPSRETLTWRYPMLVSSGFGLLHGFGFAAVLGEIGLPQTEVPLALLFFNLGVELGQLVFIAGLVGLLCAAKSFLKLAFKQAGTWGLQDFVRPTGYVVGSLAAMWTIERVIAFV
ncbi:MAG: HupE/UreJ family protein [Parvibaculum sp.]